MNINSSIAHTAALRALIALVLLVPVKLWAVAVEWDGSVDGAWEVGLNWDPDGVPTTSDDATIGAGSVVSSGASNEAGNLISNASLSVVGGTLDVIDELSNFGSVSVTAGRLEADTLINEALGDLTVDGLGAVVDGVIDLINRGSAIAKNGATLEAGALNNVDDLKITSAANGHAETFVNEDNGTATVENTDTSLVVSGNITNKGTLTIKDLGSAEGASIVNNDMLNVDSGGTFTANSMLNEVDGALGTSAAAIALSDSGTLLKINGAVVNRGTVKAELESNAIIGSIDNHKRLEVFTGARIDVESILNFVDGEVFVGSEFEVAPVKSQLVLSDNLQNSGAVTVQKNGLVTALSVTNIGDLTVNSGGSVETNSIINASDATVNVAGTGSTLILTNNVENNGLLTISDRGSMDSESLNNNKTVTIDTGGTLATNSITNNAAATIKVTDLDSMVTTAGPIVNHGSLQVKNGAVVSATFYDQLAGETILDAATLTGTISGVNILGGDLNGSGNLIGGLNVGIGGSVLPGTVLDPTKSFDLDGPLVLDGALFVDIAGMALGEFDSIDGTGLLDLGGTLNVTLLDGFLPMVGDGFTILTGSSVVGDFLATMFPVFDGGKTFDVILGADFVRLEVIAAPVPIPPAIFLFVSALFLTLVRRSPRTAQ